MDTITLKGMAFYAYHGVMREETALGQRFRIDVELKLDLEAAGKTDSLSDTVNYAKVYDIVRTIAEESQYKLIEKLAGEINRALLSAFSQVESVKTTVHKPEAPIPGILEEAAVTLEAHRKYE